MTALEGFKSPVVDFWRPEVTSFRVEVLTISDMFWCLTFDALITQVIAGILYRSMKIID